MNEVIELSKQILAEIGMAKRWTETSSMNELFLSAENLISNLAFLVGPLMDAESKYRQKVQKYISEDISVAAAESKAKSEEEYVYWKKINLTYNLAEEQIRLIKKFSDKLSDEWNRTK